MPSLSRAVPSIRAEGIGVEQVAAELGLALGPALLVLHAEAVAGLGADAPVLVGRDVKVATVIAALGAERGGATRLGGPP